MSGEGPPPSSVTRFTYPMPFTRVMIDLASISSFPKKLLSSFPSICTVTRTEWLLGALIGLGAIIGIFIV